MPRLLGSTLRWMLSLSSLVMACQGCVEDVGSTSRGKQDGRPADVEDAVELLIPIAPRDEGALSLVLTEDAVTGELAPQSDSRVRLAFGAGYPDTMSFALSAMLFLANSAPLAASAFVLEAATAVDEGNGIEARVGDDNRLVLEVQDAGIHLVELELTAEFGEAAPSTTYTFSLTVEARQVAGAEWSTCSGPFFVVSGSRPSSSRLYPLDEDGIAFEPLNTSFDRGADLIVRAMAGTRIEAPAGVASLIVTGPSQTVQVRSNYGDVARIQLIQPEQIDSIQPTFFSDQGGAKGGGTGLEAGGAIAVDLTRSPYISVFPGARVGGKGVCGGPDPALFHLRSITPDVCAIEPDGCAVRGCLTNGYVPAVAAMVATGKCELELDAPTLDHGDGLATSWAVNIEAL